jgi:hypothetical protein
MVEFFFRTEDIRPDEVRQYFVENRQDRRIIDALKNRNPTILVGNYQSSSKAWSASGPS